MNKEELQLLERAANEIKSLRSQNQLMAARLGVFDDMMSMFKSAPVYPSYGLTLPDLVYEIKKHIDESEDKLKTAEWEKEKQRNG